MQIQESEITPVEVSIFAQDAHDSQDGVMLIPTPSALDINAQYRTEKSEALCMLNTIAAQCRLGGSTRDKAYQDADFPPEQSSLWCEGPPSNDWITHPSEWARPGAKLL